MADLFGLPDTLPVARKAKSVFRPAAAVPPPAMPAECVEVGPRFGTPEWDRCTCRAYATLFFPNAGGIRRCLTCAEAEGRFSRTPFPRWSATPAGKPGSSSNPAQGAA